MPECEKPPVMFRRSEAITRSCRIAARRRLLRPHFIHQRLTDSRVVKGNEASRVFGSDNLLWRIVLPATVGLLGGCNGAPSRNILGSYFPSWMVCALVGVGVALLARMLFRVTGILDELPVPFVVMLAIGCATTFAIWLIWLA
jgi:YtcA family